MYLLLQIKHFQWNSFMETNDAYIKFEVRLQT